MHQPRLTYSESCNFLLREHWDDLLEYLFKKGWTGEGEPPMLPRMPAHDDADPVGVIMSRMMISAIEEEQMLRSENLTLPRTFIGRSELKNISF